ncbi:MAG: hypothetical protein DRJ96_04765 [Thermoprotei archaeon]|nr:MAG: hypothetical protein DRJ67_00260 [Thermoprotei archaeon]RLE97119.1 MAG: hypothetical protein DRJ96_04765 [Thermoprotei archaeon]
MRREMLDVALAAICLAAVACIAASVPFENLLSEYRFARAFPWYVYWRVGVAMFFAWIVSASIVSRKYRFTLWLMWMSALALAAAHYSLLMAEAWSGARVTLLPLVYIVEKGGGVTYKLDVAQLALLLSGLEHFLISRTSPRAPSGTQPTP